MNNVGPLTIPKQTIQSTHLDDLRDDLLAVQHKILKITLLVSSQKPNTLDQPTLNEIWEIVKGLHNQQVLLISQLYDAIL